MRRGRNYLMARCSQQQPCEPDPLYWARRACLGPAVFRGLRLLFRDGPDGPAEAFGRRTATSLPAPERRRPKNFSMKRPEMTNLNHQYAILRVDMGFVPGR